MREKVYASQCNLILENGGDPSSNLGEGVKLFLRFERGEPELSNPSDLVVAELLNKNCVRGREFW